MGVANSIAHRLDGLKSFHLKLRHLPAGLIPGSGNVSICAGRLEHRGVLILLIKKRRSGGNNTIDFFGQPYEGSQVPSIYIIITKSLSKILLSTAIVGPPKPTFPEDEILGVGRLRPQFSSCPS